MTKITFNLDPANYIFQDDYEGEITIFAPDEKVPELMQFQFAAHYDAFGRVLEHLEKDISMEGSDWNPEYKMFESLTFWDSKGDTETIPIGGIALGIGGKFDSDDMKRILQFIKDVQDEEKSYKSGPRPPIQLNLIDSNGVSSTVLAEMQPADDRPNKTGRTYSVETVEKAVARANRAMTATNGELKGETTPNADGAMVTDEMIEAMKPRFGIRAAMALMGETEHPKG